MDDLGGKSTTIFQETDPYHVQMFWTTIRLLNAPVEASGTAGTAGTAPFAAELFHPKPWGQMRFKAWRHDKGNVKFRDPPAIPLHMVFQLLASLIIKRPV